MAIYMIDNYVLRYDLDQNRAWLILTYLQDGRAKSVNWFPPKEDAVYLSDMLRNEKPVYFVESAGGRKWLTTGGEQVGEEESFA